MPDDTTDLPHSDPIPYFTELDEPMKRGLIRAVGWFILIMLIGQLISLRYTISHMFSGGMVRDDNIARMVFIETGAIVISLFGTAQVLTHGRLGRHLLPWSLGAFVAMQAIMLGFFQIRDFMNLKHFRADFVFNLVDSLGRFANQDAAYCFGIWFFTRPWVCESLPLEVVQ